MEAALVNNETSDHICQTDKDVSGNFKEVDKIKFKCGGCREELRTICLLHEHLLKEFLLGSYLYNHTTKTAFPVHVSVSKETQTESQFPVTEGQCPPLDCQSPRKVIDGKNFENQSEISKNNSHVILDNFRQTNKCNGFKNRRKRKYLKIKEEKDLRENVVKKARTKKSNISQIENGIESKGEKNDVKKIDTGSLERVAKLLNDEEEVIDYNYDGSTDDNLDNLDDLESMINGHSEGKKKVLNKKRSRGTKRKINPSSKINKPHKLKNNVKINHGSVETSDQENVKNLSQENETELDNDFIGKSGEPSEKRRGRPKCKVERFTCKHCDTVFQREKQYNLHLNSVHNPIYPFSCKQCNFKTFTNKEDFDKHKDQHPKQVFNCELCGKVLKSREGLKLHEYIHSGEKPYCCEQCDYRGRTSTQLRQHMYTHMDSKTEQCEHCGKAFFTKGKLKEHLRYCRKEFNHHCPHCQKGFPTASGLRKHILMHTGERAFVCDVCGFATFRITLLNSHMRTHTGEKPHKCKECGAKLATRGTLLLHLRTHTHEKPFVCSYCSKAFTSKWNLQTHLRQHTGETPYKCDICGQGFKQNVLRKAHMRSHQECTSIEPEPSVVKDLSTELHPAMDSDMKEHTLQNQMNVINSGEPASVTIDDRTLAPDKIHLANFMYDRSMDADILNQDIQSEKMHPLDLKLPYSSASDLKTMYNNSVINSHQLQSSSFDLINYPDMKHV